MGKQEVDQILIYLVFTLGLTLLTSVTDKAVLGDCTGSFDIL